MTPSKTFLVRWKKNGRIYVAWAEGEGYKFSPEGSPETPWRHLPEKDFWKWFEPVEQTLFEEKL